MNAQVAPVPTGRKTVTIEYTDSKPDKTITVDSWEIIVDNWVVLHVVAGQDIWINRDNIKSLKIVDVP